MGKLLLIVILIVGVIVTVVSLSMQRNRENVPDQTSHSLTKIQAKALSNEALNYSIRRLKEGSVNFVNNSATVTFQNFNVLGGSIDSLSYARNTGGDSIMVNAYVHYPQGNSSVHRSSAALVRLIPANIQAAVSANGEVIVKGNAAVVGNIEENCDPPLDFEEVFGVSKSYVQSVANNTYTDPPNNPTPCTNITWATITASNKSFKVSTAGWTGSGLLVIDGDAEFSGGNFYGILWVTGKLTITGNLTVEGALFVEGGTEISATVISGTPVIEFSYGAVSDFLGTTTFPTEMEFQIVSIFDE